jgi:Protein of unknown function (DUF3617)
MKKMLIATLLAIPGLAFAEPKLQQGQYTITRTMGMNGQQMPPQTSTFCATAEHVANAKSFLSQTHDKSCQMDNFKLNGQKASFDIACNTRGMPTKGHVEAQFSSTGVDTSVTLQAQTKNGPMTITMTAHTVRTGDCTTP